MSLINNKNLFLDSNEEESEDDSKKPVIDFFNHVNQLKIHSKKHLDVETFRKLNYFNPKDSNLIDNNEEDNKFINDNNDNNKSPSNISNNQQLLQNGNKNPIKIKKGKKEQRSVSTQNKNLLKANKKNKKPKKMKKGKRNNRKNNNSSLYQPSQINNILSKSSEISLNSENSTKRTKSQLKAHNSPEKYPEDYFSIDSSTDEENDLNDNNKGFNNSNNKFNNLNFINKKILENENSYKSDKIKKEIEKQLNEFDLMTIDTKQLFRNDNFKKKYLKNIKDYIKIAYFDLNQIPLQAIFVFCDKNGNNCSKEKKIFSGAYSKDEFIQNIEQIKNEKKIVKVELLVDFADMNKNNYSNWIEPNKDLFIDFYFLINIFN